MTIPPGRTGAANRASVVVQLGALGDVADRLVEAEQHVERLAHLQILHALDVERDVGQALLRDRDHVRIGVDALDVEVLSAAG